MFQKVGLFFLGRDGGRVGVQYRAEEEMSKEKEKQVTMYELRKSEEQLRICSGLEAQMRHTVELPCPKPEACVSVATHVLQETAVKAQS